MGDSGQCSAQRSAQRSGDFVVSAPERIGYESGDGQSEIAYESVGSSNPEGVRHAALVGSVLVVEL